MDWLKKRALPPYLCLTTHIRSRQLAVSFSRWTPSYITPPYSPSHPRHVFKNHPSGTWTKLGRRLFAKTRCCNWLGLTTYIHTRWKFCLFRQLALQSVEFPDECCTSVLFFFLFSNQSLVVESHWSFSSHHSHPDVVIISNEQMEDLSRLAQFYPSSFWVRLIRAWSIEKEAEWGRVYTNQKRTYVVFQKGPDGLLVFSLCHLFCFMQTIPPLGMSITLIGYEQFCTKAQVYLLPIRDTVTITIVWTVIWRTY